MKKFIVAIILIFFSINSFAQENSKRLIEDWEFRKGAIGGIYEIWRPSKFDFGGWAKTNLPHCINAEDAVDPDVKYFQGDTWYKTKLKVDNPYPKGRTLLHFEGAGQTTEVFTYLTKVGSHVGGYDEFTIDMTQSFNEFSQNKLFTEKYNNEFPLAIRCNNSRDLNMMPSNLSDFNVYGGLYRYVNLVYVPAISAKTVHITPTVLEDGKSANVKIQLELYNPENLKDDIDLTIFIKSPDGKEVYSSTVQQSPFSGNNQVFEFKLKNPELWSPDNPNLYTCEFTLSSKHGKQTINEQFGLRYFEFQKNGPFFLNGERLLLRGTHRHEDHAGVAAAMTEEMTLHEMKMIKEMGVNFIRLGHYQQSKIVLQACDELGILVYEEIPWCRGGLGNENYQDQGKRMLTNLISQHYNHPSVILWGLGNENNWAGDYETFDEEAIRAYMQELNDLSHKLDPTRKTAIRRCPFCADIVDVYSPSIWAGWYRGKFTDYQKVSKMEMEKTDRFIHVEWGASNHALRHSETPDIGLEKITSSEEANEKDGDFLMIGGDTRASKDSEWSETYACNLIDWHLKEQENMDWLTGTAYWIFKDYSTPLRDRNPIPYVNQKGVIERDFTKKEAYYLFQSYWTQKPMIRIYGHSWETRWGDVDEEKIVKIYSNCSEVELVVNGEKLAKKTRNSQDFPAAGLRWAVKFKEGENTIKAIGYNNRIKVIDEIKVQYQTDKWEKPAELKLSKHSETNDTITLKAEVFDKNGIKCLDARNVIRFELAGDGELIDNLGTSTTSRVVQLYNGHAYISVSKNNGSSIVSVSTKDIATQFYKAD